MPTSVKKSVKDVDLKLHKTDTGSSAVQIAELTDRIISLTTHAKVNKHDFMSRRGLLQLVGRRKRLLKYIARTDPDQYLTIVEKLGLRH
jgi:small subunit ribosomal protein S15